METADLASGVPAQQNVQISLSPYKQSNKHSCTTFAGVPDGLAPRGVVREGTDASAWKLSRVEIPLACSVQTFVIPVSEQVFERHISGAVGVDGGRPRGRLESKPWD